MRNILHSLVILCFVLASVSPACKFISGQGFMEICGADGNIKQAQVPEELLAFLPSSASEEQPVQDHEQALEDCTFCFAASHLSVVIGDVAQLTALNIDPILLRHENAAFAQRQARLYQPRGPPAFLV